MLVPLLSPLPVHLQLSLSLKAPHPLEGYLDRFEPVLSPRPAVATYPCCTKKRFASLDQAQAICTRNSTCP